MYAFMYVMYYLTNINITKMATIRANKNNTRRYLYDIYIYTVYVYIYIYYNNIYIHI